MRELKFRAWNRDKRIMVYNTEDSDDFHTDFDVPCIVEEVNDIFRADDTYEWMQFTGLKDNKGRDIYEGDIVRHKTIGCYTGEDLSDDSVGIIIWLGSGFKYQKGEDIDRCKFACGNELICQEHYEVIGNIYENPELI